MKYVVECHTGTEETFADNPDHVFVYDTALAAVGKIEDIMWTSARNQEHQSPIVRMRCMEE